MLEVCGEHNCSNDMFRLVTDEDSNIMQAMLSEKKKNKKNSYFRLVKKSVKRMMVVRGIGAVPNLPRGV